MDIDMILQNAVDSGASDIFLVAGSPVSYRMNGVITPQGDSPLNPQQVAGLIGEIYSLDKSGRGKDRFDKTGDDDFSFSVSKLGRFRVNVYRQRGSSAAVLRVVRFELPNPKELSIPDIVVNLGEKKKGLVLVTGPAGSGKSTTLACIVDQINRTRNAHIVIIEDPIEYLHRHQKSIVSQREVSEDTDSYLSALRAALRQSPNVVLLGEMRDFETISVAMTAAETGQLVLSTLHTVGAANTIDRIIDVFPPAQQQQIRVQLSMVLEAVVSQQLVPTKDGSLIPVFEIMLVNSAIRNLIRESKIHQINNVIFSSAGEGMVAMDAGLHDLYLKGVISADTALLYCTNLEYMSKKITPNSPVMIKH